MRIALPRWRNAGLGPGRLHAHITAVRRLAEAGPPVDLVVFPELSLCGYPVRDHLGDGRGDRATATEHAALAAVSEPIATSRAVAALADLAAEHRCAIVFGIAEADRGVVHDTVVMADATGAVTSYRKVHLTDDELRIFAPGDRAVVVPAVIGAAAEPIQVGLSSCYDKQFPQLYQDQRELGAGLSIISSAWSSSRVGPRRAARGDDVLMMQSRLFDRARAAETGMVVVSTNYVGAKLPGSSAAFCGGARVIDPLGREERPEAGLPGRRTWCIDLPQVLDPVVASDAIA